MRSDTLIKIESLIAPSFLICR